MKLTPDLLQTGIFIACSFCPRNNPKLFSSPSIDHRAVKRGRPQNWTKRLINQNVKACQRSLLVTLITSQLNLKFFAVCVETFVIGVDPVIVFSLLQNSEPNVSLFVDNIDNWQLMSFANIEVSLIKKSSVKILYIFKLGIVHK